MADIRDPFAPGRDLVTRPNFTRPGIDVPQMSPAQPRPDKVMPSRPSGRDLTVRPNFTTGGSGPLPQVERVDLPKASPQVIRPNPARAAAQAATLRAPAPAPVLDTSRLPPLPADRALSSAAAEAYNASPEGRATARQFAQEKFARAGGGSKYVPPNSAAAPAGAAPKPAMPSTGGLRRAAEGAKGLGKFASTTLQAATVPLMVQEMASFTGAEDQKVIDAAIDREKSQLQDMRDQYGDETLRAAYKSKSPWYHFGGVEHSRPEDLEKWTGEYLKQDAGGGRGFMIPPSGAQRPEANPGTRPFTPNEGGRGAGFKDPRLVADVVEGASGKIEDRTLRANANSPKDFTQALAGVPQNMPAGLRDGAVYKTKDANGRTVYSGTNVKQNAAILGGQGNLQGYLGGGNPEPTVDAQGNRLDGRTQEFVAQPQAAQPQAQVAQGQAPVTTVAKSTDAAGNVTYSGNSTRPAAAQQPAAAAQPASPSLDFDASRGAVSTLPKGISPFASADSNGALSAARQAAADRGDWDAVSRSYGEAPQGGQGGPSLRMGGGGYSAGPSVPAHVAQSEKFAQQVARSDAESAARAALKSGSLRERSRGMATLAQLAGGDQDAATSRYNTDATAATARYGSDNSLRGQVYSADSQNDANRYTADMGLRSAYAKNMPAQMQRQAQSMAMQMANGDIPTALRILAQNGYSGEGLIAAQNALNSDQTTQQNLSDGARKAAVARFGQFLQTGDDGKPMAGAEGALTNAMESIVPGSTQMREDELAAPIRLPDGTVMTRQAVLTAGLNILKGLNTTKDNAFLQSIGWDPANPRLDQLPDLNGAKLDRVGWVKGKVKGGNVESANYQLDLGGGRTLYLPHDQIGENELALLRAKGVNIPR